MQPESITLASPTPNPSAISELSEAPIYREVTGSSRAVSPARIFPSLVRALGWRVSDPGSGTSTPALLASYDPDSRSWKTSELSLFEDSTKFSGALPRSGTMRNGRIYAPPMSERPISVNGSGLLPTPTAGGHTQNRDPYPGAPIRYSLIGMARYGMWPTPRAGDAKGGTYQRDRGQKGKERPTLTGAVMMWPTPRLSDAERGGRGDLIQAVRGNPNKHYRFPTPTTHDGTQVDPPSHRNGRRNQPCLGTIVNQEAGTTGGQLNPTWVEWLLGYPLHWTEV